MSNIELGNGGSELQCHIHSSCMKSNDRKHLVNRSLIVLQHVKSSNAHGKQPISARRTHSIPPPIHVILEPIPHSPHHQPIPTASSDPLHSRQLLQSSIDRPSDPRHFRSKKPSVLRSPRSSRPPLQHPQCRQGLRASAVRTPTGDDDAFRARRAFSHAIVPENKKSCGF